MKSIKSIIFISFLIIININAQDQADMMKKWKEAVTPGRMHELLSKMVGEWDTEMTFIEQTGQEMKSKGFVKTEEILGGRYFLTSQNGTMMGMPFEGKGLDAYDNVSKEFISVWVDNMGTGITVMKGYYDEKTNSFNYKGESLDPISGKVVTYRTILKIENDNKMNFEMFSNQSGIETKMFTMVYTKRK